MFGVDTSDSIVVFPPLRRLFRSAHCDFHSASCPDSLFRLHATTVRSFVISFIRSSNISPVRYSDAPISPGVCNRQLLIHFFCLTAYLPRLCIITNHESSGELQEGIGGLPCCNVFPPEVRPSMEQCDEQKGQTAMHD